MSFQFSPITSPDPVTGHPAIPTGFRLLGSHEIPDETTDRWWSLGLDGWKRTAWAPDDRGLTVAERRIRSAEGGTPSRILLHYITPLP